MGKHIDKVFLNAVDLEKLCFCSSGGPLMDIIETSEGSRTGYLAVRAMDYANCISSILANTPEENETIRNAARYVYTRRSFIFYFLTHKI